MGRGDLHVAADLAQDPALRVGELEGERFQEGLDEAEVGA